MSTASCLLRTIAALVVTVLTTALLASGASPAAARGSDRATASAAASKAPITPLRCRYFDMGSTSENYELCISVRYRLKQDRISIFESGVQNDLNREIQGSCTSREDETFRWGGSVTATAEGKAWIFAKVSGSVTASFDKTRTTSYSVSSTFPVAPKSTVYCYYVEVEERFMTRQCITTAYTGGRKCYDKVFHAPKREIWIISKDPRNF